MQTHPGSDPCSPPDSEHLVTKSCVDALHAIALRLLQGVHTPSLQPTLLVNEAWLKVFSGKATIRDAAHCRAVMVLAMKQFLIDHERAKKTEKRGGGRSPAGGSSPQPLDALLDSYIHNAGGSVVDLSEALDRLRVRNPDGALVVDQYFFLSLSIKEIAQAISKSESSTRRLLTEATEHLRRDLKR